MTLGKFLKVSVLWFLIGQLEALTVPHTEGCGMHRVLRAVPGTECVQCMAGATLLDLHHDTVTFMPIVGPVKFRARSDFLQDQGII